MGFGFKMAMPKGLRRRHLNLKKRRLSLSSEIIAGGYLHPQDDGVVAEGLATGPAVHATSCRSEIGAAARLRQGPDEHSGFFSPESGEPAKNAIKKPDGRTIRLKNAAEY